MLLDGRPVNAVRGTLDFIARLANQYAPDSLVCAWDDDWRPAFRVEAIPSYKAHRVASGAAGAVTFAKGGCTGMGTPPRSTDFADPKVSIGTMTSEDCTLIIER